MSSEQNNSISVPPPPPTQLPPPVVVKTTRATTSTAPPKQPKYFIDTDIGRKVNLTERIVRNNKNSTDELITFVCISDTHNSHNSLLDKIPEKGHVLIHCGDSTNDGTLEELNQFNMFLGYMRSRFEYIVVIAGNHDYGLDTSFYTDPYPDPASVLNNATHYLKDNMINLYGINIYGTPWVNCNMAFGADSNNLAKIWQKIPENVDILLTHTPAHGILDLAWSKRQTSSDECGTCGKKHKSFEHWGDPALRRHVLDRVKPKIHICGHVHDDHGATIIDDTVFINCASQLALLRKPFYFEYPRQQINSVPDHRKSRCDIQ
jgi:Icc-related predicted phosphoesterase